MRTIYCILFILLAAPFANGQRACTAADYQQALLLSHPGLQQQVAEIEAFTQRFTAANNRNADSATEPIITIPVVIHVLYNNDYQNISEERILNQLAILNKAFRGQNDDIGRTPAHFTSRVADCRIQFCLAKVDPGGRATKGIVRKYTWVNSWTDNDKMKYTTQGGDNAWDTKRYLNIWVCNMGRLLGYASFPGGPADRDGVVIHYNYFGVNSSVLPYDEGKTAVHELGHWMNLKHIWGDYECGSDGVDDTPPQQGFTFGCPSGIRVSCNNAPTGDMYMNFMDFTYDDCMFMFSNGQKQRMRALFAPGGVRHSLGVSDACTATPTAEGAPLPEEVLVEGRPVKVYPNPVQGQLIVEFRSDMEMTGKTYHIVNAQGVTVLSGIMGQNKQQINVSAITPGIYFFKIAGNKKQVVEKFTKL
jgi:Pregnancy-associated plasma protein-A/Secretion system C-terminal sorting domain